MRQVSTLKKVVPDISRPKKYRHYFDALDEREIGRKFSDSRAFMAAPVSYYFLTVGIECMSILIDASCWFIPFIKTWDHIQMGRNLHLRKCLLTTSQ